MNRRGLIRIDDRKVRELERLFSGVLPAQLKRARKIALSRTRRGAKTRVSQLIRVKGKKNYNIPASRAKKGITLGRIKDEQFLVSGETKPLSLTTFSRTRDLFRSGAGVSVEVIKGNRTKIATGFIRQPTGGPQVFRREFVGGQSGPQVGRRPIRRLIGPSVAVMMNQNEAEDDLAEDLNDRFERELISALNRALR